MYDKYDNDKSGDILCRKNQDIDVEQHDTLVASRLIELTVASLPMKSNRK